MLGTATALVALACALTLVTAGPAAAQTEPPPAAAEWTADLSRGEAAGVRLDGGAARLDPGGTFLAHAEEAQAAGEPRPTGLLTFPPRELAHPTDRVTATVDADMPPGAFVTVDVRGRRGSGNWTEWLPGERAAGRLTAALPAPASEVQARLVLAGDPGAEPVVHGVRLTAHRATRAQPLTENAARIPLSYRVFATREGLVGGKTANGHVIAQRDHFVALPSRRALAPRGRSDYSVKVCAPTGRCAFAPVWDVGPWNTRDDYWNPPHQRQQWNDLPQGVPQAQAAHQHGYNGGRDQYNRRVANPAGIDIGDGMFWDALGLSDNAWVTVDYLWTGSVRLSRVTGAGQVLAAPNAAAEVVGIVADRAAVPVQCVLTAGPDRWLRIGPDQYLTASLVAGLGQAPVC